ncbi:DUF192 domain-containing protein [Salinicola sp. DM10]|uniref:DUF192 domain-containing protein n=1 Tax=Salinicola sp. DM10 TaxID=2815721 RepID=UPI001A8C6AF9|nr:DUF192 domain-containing protein [Salinicola sp. DM10]MCE3026941.1 DUF192 domain-containing protein [Salinicola sp. DM10]
MLNSGKTARRRAGLRLPAATLRWGTALALLAWAVVAGAAETGRLGLSGASGDYTLRIEVAATAEQRARGLMARDALPEDAGMLFLYPAEQPGSSAYWMYRTRIPLDIAFLGADGTIRALKTMPPCRAEMPSRCPAYPAGVAFRAALETNAGYFAQRGLGVGDRVDLAPWLTVP